MPKLHQIIERHWQRPNPFLSFLLKPLSKLFAKIAAKRRDDFISGRLKSEFGLFEGIVALRKVMTNTFCVRFFMMYCASRGNEVGIL